MQPEKTSQVILSKAIIDPKDGKKKTKKKKPTTTTEPMDTEEVPEEVKLESIDVLSRLVQTCPNMSRLVQTCPTMGQNKKAPKNNLTQFFINIIFLSKNKTCMKILTHTLMQNTFNQISH